MASLLKRTITRTDPKTGREIKRKSKKWYGKYVDEFGIERRVALATDKDAAQTMLNETVRKAECRQFGLVDPFDEQHKRPLKQHLRDFRAHLEAKGNGKGHIENTISRVQAILDGCPFRRIGDINASRVAIWLKDKRDAGDFGVSTSNGYLVAFKGFCNWLVKDRRTGHNPVAHLSRLNPDADINRQRRHLPAEQFSRLVDAAETGEVVCGLSGKEREQPESVPNRWHQIRHQVMACHAHGCPRLTTKTIKLQSRPQSTSR